MELLPLFLSRAAYDLFLGSLLTVWAVIGGHAFGLGAAVACVLHILGYLKFEDDCDGMKILQIAWAIDKMLAEYDYSEEEVDCEQVSFFDDELPCEAAPQSEIHVAASEGGRNASIHDLLSSNVMLASISLLLVKICAVTVYGVTAVMILANVIHVLF